MIFYVVKKLQQFAFVCMALCGLFISSGIEAAEADDPAWRSFLHGLSEPALIGANVDHEAANAVVRPLPSPDSWQINAGKFRLGSRLFHESRLSTGNGIACVTCHAGTLSGADRRRVSVGVGGAEGILNALTVFNAAFNFRQFWDGRAVTLEDQALLPIETEFEMANSLEAVQRFLDNDPDYVQQFTAVYPDGVSIANMADAVAHFQRSTFIRLDTPFQRFLNGEQNALSAIEKQGWQRFQELGCSSCHNGINLGGNSYQQLGSLKPYYGAADMADDDDIGVAARSGLPGHRHVFRVPGLHGVATTPPYFHDGSVTTLEEAVSLMGDYQLGRQLDNSDVESITAFLKSLGGHFNSSREGLPANPYELEVGEGAWQLQPANANQTLWDNDHRRAYRQVLDSIDTAYQALLHELDRLIGGQVAHFDFLQFRHLELIRFARALRHPPSSLAQSRRRELIEHADALLAQIMALEWPIADILIARAVTQNLEALPADPAINRTVTLAEAELLLGQERRRAEQALSEVRSQALNSHSNALRELLNSAQ